MALSWSSAGRRATKGGASLHTGEGSNRPKTLEELGSAALERRRQVEQHGVCAHSLQRRWTGGYLWDDARSFALACLLAILELSADSI